MTHRNKSRPIELPPRTGDHGFTLIEAVMSMLIVGLMLVTAMNTIGASRVSQSRNAEQVTGPMLAQDLMSEVLNQYYQEPIDTVEFGREAGETGGNRSAWDDVDDYDGWSKSPPDALENKDGTTIPDLKGWGREVKVVFVNPGLVNTSVSDIGHKRIKVTVTHMGRVVTELWALRTSGWPDP